MLRTTTNVMGLVLLLFSGWVSALGLGEIKMNSAMNEPMDAEVEILNLGDLTENEVQVKLASAQDFERAGVERLFLLVDLRFSLDLSKRSRPLLRITSKKPIKEPYLDFLVDMRWTSGRMLREYTILMDLPAFAMEKPMGKQVTATRKSSPTVTAVPVTSSRGTSESLTAPISSPEQSAEEIVESSSAPVTEARVSESGSYTVNAGDTLWAIADMNRPEGASVQQAIMAIYKSNPDAFINNNSNLVRKGAVLRIPNAGDIEDLSHQAAVNELKKHTDTWQSEASLMAPEAVIEAVSDDSVSTSSSSNTDSGSLRLSAANGGGDAAGTGTGGDGAGGNFRQEQVENELAIAQEELERSVRENEELKQKLSLLEEQVSTMSRLVELEDTGLRGAQLAAETPEMSGEEPAEGSSESFSFSDIVEDGVDEVATDVSEDGLVQTETASSAMEAAASRPEAQPPVVEEEVGLVAKLTGLAESMAGNIKNLLLPVGAGLLLIVGLLVMVKRRQGRADDTDS